MVSALTPCDQPLAKYEDLFKDMPPYATRDQLTGWLAAWLTGLSLCLMAFDFSLTACGAARLGCLAGRSARVNSI